MRALSIRIHPVKALVALAALAMVALAATAAAPAPAPAEGVGPKPKVGDVAPAFSLTDQLWSADRKTSGAYSHWARIPVSDLTPGDYVLELEAKSLAEPMRVVKREIAIRVRE